MNDHSIVFASFYSLTIGLFPVGFRCITRRIVTGTAAIRDRRDSRYSRLSGFVIPGGPALWCLGVCDHQ
jgi:hypothetical protein